MRHNGFAATMGVPPSDGVSPRALGSMLGDAPGSAVCEAPAVDDTHRYFVFLRAINTGGRRLTNDEMLAPFRNRGFLDVAAYQAAGNITFRSADPVDPEVLDAELADSYGFEAPTFVRRADDLRRIADSSPFGGDDLAGTEGRVQVTFLSSRPAHDAIASVAALVDAPDRVVVDGWEWYWLPQAGVSGSALPVARIERLLGPMTMRTLGTVQRMLAKFPD